MRTVYLQRPRISINGSFSDWTEVLTRVPYGSILGPLLFNILLSDIFMFISKRNLGNYADDNTLYSTQKDLNRIRRNFEIDFLVLHQLFNENHMIIDNRKSVIGSKDR